MPPPYLSTPTSAARHSHLDRLTVTLVRTTGLNAASAPYVTLELFNSGGSGNGDGGCAPRQKRETLRPPSVANFVLSDQQQQGAIATWDQQQFLL